ncbi:unnamed protein product [Rhizoctonia solani]|uniref:Uncharacterized protein n=1 Tax=Rhizoctonia solani TaxID=456999 RepID=A0A8H2ZWX8_9AGAM|nr:unnamed protein product [Rhizoctonia solani]
MHSPPRSPVQQAAPKSPQSPRRALPQPPQRNPQSKPGRPPPPLPPRPTSAEPHIHEVGVDLPPSGGPLSPTAGRIQAAAKIPDPVEGKGTRASRVSEHLKMSSRTRSVSPTGRRFPVPSNRPAPVEVRAPEAPTDFELGILSPHSIHPALPGVVAGAVNTKGGIAEGKAQNLERAPAENETEKAGTQGARESRRVDRKSPERSPRKSEQQSQPPPGPRGGRENRSPARALPRPPVRTEAESQDVPPTPQVLPSDKPPTSPRKKLPHSVSAPTVASISHPPPPTFNPLQPMSTGLTALERRLTIKPERSPVPSAAPIQKPAQQPKQSMPSQKEEPTIDWGEIARIGKLKSFAAAHKKPTIPAFAVPEIPAASFEKPKTVVIRKPVPSIHEDEDLPILPERKTPTSSHPPSPRTDVPIAKAKPLVRYELTDSPTPKVVTNLETAGSPGSTIQSPVQLPSRPSTQPQSQPPVQPASFPVVQSFQEVHCEVPGSPSGLGSGSVPPSSQSIAPVQVDSPSSHPPSPHTPSTHTSEVKPLVRYELSDNPTPRISSQPATPKVVGLTQLPFHPSAQANRAPAQRASVPLPIPSRPPQDRFSKPVSTPPQSRPTSRPASVAATSSPAAELKPLVRYELTDNPMPKATPRPKAHETTPAPTRVPIQAPTRQLSTQNAPWSVPPTRSESVTAPPRPQVQGETRHAAFTVLSSPVIETQPLGPSELTYEPISFMPAEVPPKAKRDTPQSPARLPLKPIDTTIFPQELSQPITSPTRPGPSASATTPVVPNHVPRYQLSDGPVSRPAVRYQLTDGPVSKPPATGPTSVSAPRPEAILTSHRANLRPVSSTKPPPQPKARPRTPPSPIPAAFVPLPQSPVKAMVPPKAVITSRPPPPPFPRLEDRMVDPALPVQTQSASTKHRDPSPRRPRPQEPARPNIPVEGDVFGGEQRRVSDPQRIGGETQASQKAKYFESLAAAKRSNSPEKLQATPQKGRQILRPQQANTNQPIVGTRHVQVQIQPPPSQPQSPPRMAPVQTAPAPMQILAPRPIPSPRASPILNRDLPLRSPSPVFTANPVLPTIPTARSLIPITSSGFEVPVVLPGRDARERADAALREAELFRLKREAITRVPMWLGNEHTPQAPPPTRAVRSSNAIELPPQSYWDIQQLTQDEPTMEELLSRQSTPVSRVAYDPQLKHPRPRPVSSRPPALMPSDKELIDKHNVQQSARGGRGGQVTTVTSIWESGKDDSTAAPAPERKHQAKRYTAPVGMFGITAKGLSPNEGATGMIKSTSVPAMVNTGQAVPVLSSTASLARPVGASGTRIRMVPFAPSIPESQSDDILMRKTSQSSDNVPVGQARLKELIGKYQS